MIWRGVGEERGEMGEKRWGRRGEERDYSFWKLGLYFSIVLYFTNCNDDHINNAIVIIM